LNKIDQSQAELVKIWRIFAHVVSRCELTFDLLKLNF